MESRSVQHKRLPKQFIRWEHIVAESDAKGPEMLELGQIFRVRVAKWMATKVQIEMALAEQFRTVAQHTQHLTTALKHIVLSICKEIWLFYLTIE